MRAENLADRMIRMAGLGTPFDLPSRVAMLSYSNFGSAQGDSRSEVLKALATVLQRMPSVMIEGEMQADTAIFPEISEDSFPFSTLKGRANALTFPNRDSGNIAIKPLMRMAGGKTIGPIHNGLQKPVHLLQRGLDVD